MFSNFLKNARSGFKPARLCKAAGGREVLEMDIGALIQNALKNNQAFVAVHEGKKLVFINATPHVLRFDDGTVLQPNQELAKILTAKPQETKIDEFNGVAFVRTEFVGTDDGWKFVQAANDFNNAQSDAKVCIIGSIIAAQAYGAPVVSPITTPETTRAPPDRKVCFKNKFNAYW